MNIHMYWTDEKLIGKTPDEIKWEEVWQPNITIMNELELNKESVYEILDSKTGKVKQKLGIVGNISNFMDLHDFPFDSDIINLVCKIHFQFS